LRSDCGAPSSARARNRQQGSPTIGQAGFCAVLFDETRKTDPTVPLAAMTFDFQQVELADKLAQRD
jgi:hypothetical protein